MSVADDAVKAAAAGLDFTKPLDRLRGAYIRRRVDALHHDNSTWDATKLASQVKTEMAAVADYLTRKAPLLNNTDAGNPGHIDLKVGAALITLSIDNGSFGQRMFDGLEKQARANRQAWVTQIVWRAVAMHGDVLWKALAPPKLAEPALDEMLDRRLHAVEMMHFVVNSAGFGHLGRPWQVSGPTGPFVDGFRIRSVEYPWVQPADPFDTALKNNTDWHLDHSITTAGLTSEYDYDPPSHMRIHLPADVASAWKVDANLTWIRLQAAAVSDPTDLINKMWAPREDMWDRSWMFCDHVGSLLTLEAFWFGTTRREGKSDTFSAVMKRPDYVRLGPFVGDNHQRGTLMADKDDQFFENTSVDLDDLQIGDFVRFWNSRVYELWPPYAGAWGSEFSLVMGLDVDGHTGKMLKPASGGPQMSLAGHGMHTTSYDSMAAEATEHLKTRWLSAFGVILGVSADSTTDHGQRYVRWTPYEAFDAPGPWWVEIPDKTWRDEWLYTSQSDVLKGIPRTVANDPGGTGYTPPPDTNAVYFPLFEPVVDRTDADGDSWRAYLRKRKSTATFRLKSTTLKPIAIDGRLAQGLFYRGSGAKLPVVRPRVRP